MGWTVSFFESTITRSSVYLTLRPMPKTRWIQCRKGMRRIFLNNFLMRTIAWIPSIYITSIAM